MRKLWTLSCDQAGDVLLSSASHINDFGSWLAVYRVIPPSATRSHAESLRAELRSVVKICLVLEMTDQSETLKPGPHIFYNRECEFKRSYTILPRIAIYVGFYIIRHSHFLKEKPLSDHRRTQRHDTCFGVTIELMTQCF